MHFIHTNLLDFNTLISNFLSHFLFLQVSSGIHPLYWKLRLLYVTCLKIQKFIVQAFIYKLQVLLFFNPYLTKDHPFLHQVM